jgi:hypothetical protein
MKKAQYKYSKDSEKINDRSGGQSKEARAGPKKNRGQRSRWCPVNRPGGVL